MYFLLEACNIFLINVCAIFHQLSLFSTHIIIHFKIFMLWKSVPYVWQYYFSIVCMTILFQYRMYDNIISVSYVWQYYFSIVCMTILFQYRMYDNIISVSYVWQYCFSIVCMSIISASYVVLNLTVYSLNNFIFLSPVTASGRRGWGNQRTKISSGKRGIQRRARGSE